jgi:hypothetical protein
MLLITSASPALSGNERGMVLESGWVERMSAEQPNRSRENAQLARRISLGECATTTGTTEVCVVQGVVCVLCVCVCGWT